MAEEVRVMDKDDFPARLESRRLRMHGYHINYGDPMLSLFGTNPWVAYSTSTMNG